MQREITPIFGQRKLVLKETKRAVTPFRGLSVFFEFLGRIGYAEAVRQHMPIELRSPNAIDPAHTFTAFVISVLAGGRRFAHAGLLRADEALHSLLGMPRFPSDDTMRNPFKRFAMGQVYRFFSGLWEWQIQRLPERVEGYSLDLDSTVFERYGRQQGALKGYNPRKHGRPSHHPLLAILGEAHWVLHGWLRSGNCSAALSGRRWQYPSGNPWMRSIRWESFKLSSGAGIKRDALWWCASGCEKTKHRQGDGCWKFPVIPSASL